MLLAFILLLTGCIGLNRPQSSDLRRKIIIDTDTGADDAAAIVMAALQPQTDILGITVVAGNVTLQQGAENALMTLEMAGVTDVPVYCGSKSTVTGKEYAIFSVFGEDGMGDAGLIHPTKLPESENAVDFILSTVAAFPQEVELVALGPVTNIALAIRQDPETMAKAKHIWVMGTAGFGPGNATPFSEFNTYMDPEAMKILTDSGLPITVIGLDTNTENTYITKTEQQALLLGNDLERFIGNSMNGLMEYNRITQGQEVANLPDPVAMACVLWKDYVTEVLPCHAEVTVTPGETYGQVLFHKKGEEADDSSSPPKYNINVVTQTKNKQFKQRFLQMLKEHRP